MDHMEFMERCPAHVLELVEVGQARQLQAAGMPGVMAKHS